MSWSSRKKKTPFVPFIFSKGNFFNICVLCQWILYWILFQNIHTCTYQKTLLNTVFHLFLKSSKAFRELSSYKKQPNIFCWKANREGGLFDINWTWSTYTNLTKVFWEYVSGFDFAVETYLYSSMYYHNGIYVMVFSI